MNKKRMFIMAAALGCAGCAAAGAADEPIPVASRYSGDLAALTLAWPPKELGPLRALFERDKENPALVCFKTPGDDLYIGSAQYQVISAPFDQAVRVLDDIPGRAGLFKNLKVSRVEERRPGRLTVFNEQRIGIPFVRNEKNKVFLWMSEQKSPRRKFYRYQLISSNHLKFNDVLVVLEAAGPLRTGYTKYNFYDADWGLAKTLGRSNIWKENLRDIVQSDLALRFKAEHPEWSTGRIFKKSLEQAKGTDTEACLEASRTWPVRE